MHATQIVRKAIGETPAQYWQTLCETRAKGNPKQSGSFFRFDAPRISSLLLGLEWEFGIFPEGLIVPPAKAYVARQVPGTSNMMPISEVPDDTLVFLEDHKDTGIVECVWVTNKVQGQPVRLVTLIVGPTDGHDTVWTFFPGRPVEPSKVERRPSTGVFRGRDLHQAVVTVRIARALGVKWVKIATPVAGEQLANVQQSQQNDGVSSL